MIPRPGDLIESNRTGVNRYRVVSAGTYSDGASVHCHVVYPDDGTQHPRKNDAWFSGMREEGDLLVSCWYEPWMSFYTALIGPDNTSPRRMELRLIERGHYEEQLDLFGE